MKMFKRNCCDGVYNSFDVHFTSACDNKCAHCIDGKYNGLGIKKPDPKAIAKTIIDNKEGYDDVLFLGGEPCLYLEELLECIESIQASTKLKVYITSAMPKTCFDNPKLFNKLLDIIDGLNISAQHYDETAADEIRACKSKYDRQAFYASLPHKNKIRINLNIVKPFLYTKEQLLECIIHYDKMGFDEIKLSEIQHGKEYFVSFEKTFGLNLGSPFYHGCQTHLEKRGVFENINTPILLKRSCFMCEETLDASLLDGVKVGYKMLNPKITNKYSVIYSNGEMHNGWI